MALNNQAKQQFIEGMVADFVKDFKAQSGGGDVSPELVEGQRKWATRLCERLVTLIKNGEVTFQFDSTTFKTEKVK